MDKAQDDLFAGHLTDEQYRVTQEKATERPFTGCYLDNKEEGIYCCVVCDTELFGSELKSESGSGWPRVSLPLADDNVRIERDTSHGMVREEGCAAHCGAHLGIFSTTGRSRPDYAIASTRLRWIPARRNNNFVTTKAN